jgi:hypothetical protein
MIKQVPKILINIKMQNKMLKYHKLVYGNKKQIKDLLDH